MTERADPDCIADLDAMGALYTRHAARVRSLVRLAVTAPETVVEDACQTAWLRLVRRRSDVHPDAAVSWVVKTARREAWRQLGRTERERPLSELESQSTRRCTPDLLDDLVARSARREALRALSDRQRRLVWLQGLGLSYEEIAGTTGDSRRTVERQLERARGSLRRPEAA